MSGGMPWAHIVGSNRIAGYPIESHDALNQFRLLRPTKMYPDNIGFLPYNPQPFPASRASWPAVQQPAQNTYFSTSSSPRRASCQTRSPARGHCVWRWAWGRAPPPRWCPEGPLVGRPRVCLPRQLRQPWSLTAGDGTGHSPLAHFLLPVPPQASSLGYTCDISYPWEHFNEMSWKATLFDVLLFLSQLLASSQPSKASFRGFTYDSSALCKKYQRNIHCHLRDQLRFNRFFN